MRGVLAIAFVLLLLGASPAFAVARSTITCAASVTSNLSTVPAIRDLKPSVLPVLEYNAEPDAREFKHVTRLQDVAVGLYVYRVDEATAHMRLFEYGEERHPALLADTPLSASLTELSFRPPGGDDMVTAYCYW